MLWFKEAFLPNIGPDRLQLLILDGHDSHNFVELIELAAENNVYIIELPAHTSNWLQPCDRTVFGPLKNAYRKACEDLMTQFPGTLVSRASFCGLLKKAWEEALSPNNIISGFRACGIYPFNPESVPTEAYLPNCMYSVQELVEKETLVLNGTALLTPVGEATTKTSTEILLSTPGLNNLSATVTMEEPSTSTQNILNITDFASLDPEVVARACATLSLETVLEMFERTLSKQQLHCFRYLYDKKYSLDQDETFSTWKKLKSLSEEQEQQAPSASEIMDLNLSVGTFPSFSESLAGDLDIEDSNAKIVRHGFTMLARVSMRKGQNTFCAFHVMTLKAMAGVTFLY